MKVAGPYFSILSILLTHSNAFFVYFITGNINFPSNIPYLQVHRTCLFLFIILYSIFFYKLFPVVIFLCNNIPF